MVETPLRPSPLPAQPDEFVVYHLVNPQTDCEYPYLAINADRSVLLSIGERTVGFDFEIPAEAHRWLTKDYAPTKELFQLHFTAVQSLIEQAFPGGAVFGFVHFADDLTIRAMELSLWRQQTAEGGPEYLVHAAGDYERWYREPNLHTAVSADERALIEFCCSTFGTLPGEYAHLLTAPSTLKYRVKAHRVN